MTDIRIESSKPFIKWEHIDGPLLICADGTPHWLTMWERLAMRAGIYTVDDLDMMHNRGDRRG